MRTTTDRATMGKGSVTHGGLIARCGLRWSILLGSCLALAVAGRSAIGQDLDVSGGTITGNSTAATFDRIFVSGTAADGTRSTYNADATLTVTDHVTVFDAGIFNVNALVSIGNYIYADTLTPGSSSGSVRLNVSGTISALQGLFGGAGSLVQAGGHYSLGVLSLNNAGTIDYQSNDLISLQVDLVDSTLRLGRALDVGSINLTGSVAALETNGHTFSTASLTVGSGAAFALTSSGSITPNGTILVDNGALTLDRDVSGLFQTQLIGSGATISGTGRYETVTLFASNGADVPFRAGDAITIFASISDATITVTGTTLSAGALYVSGSTATVAGTGNYSLQTLSLTNGASLVFDSADSVSGFVGVADSTLVLDADLVTNQINLTGSAATLTGTGNYSTAFLVVSRAPTFSYRTGDSITGDVFLFDTPLTLDKALELTGGLTLSGPAAGLVGPHDYRVGSLSLSNSSLSYDGGDSITTAVVVSSGTLALDKDLALVNSLTLTSATLSGSGRYAAPNVVLTSSTLAYRTGDSITNTVQLFDNATLVLERSLVVTDFLALSGTSTISGSGAYTAPALFLSGGSTLAYRTGDTITQTVSIVDSRFTLERDLVVSGQLSLAGPLAAISGTGALAVNGVQVANGALLTARAGDSIIGDVFLQTGGDLVAQTPLSLKSLLIDAGVGSVLTLQSFTGTGPVGPWGLTVDGDRTAEIGSFLADGRILSPGAPDGVTTIFDAGSNRTFLVAVPEPTTLVMAAIAAAAAFFRRNRSVRTR
ncbi:MAG: PEP-CTERM sorting domain-containing protein [Planctomycetes bacterium]|nr:PEP-CTERM sorting domain-containing protein [Planctomycetota bacterium]